MQVGAADKEEAHNEYEKCRAENNNAATAADVGPPPTGSRLGRIKWMEALRKNGACPQFPTTAKEKVSAFLFKKVMEVAARHSNSSINYVIQILVFDSFTGLCDVIYAPWLWVQDQEQDQTIRE